MSDRIEWGIAKDGPIRVYLYGTELGDGVRVTHEAAIAVGRQVIEGTKDELVTLLEDGLALARLIDAPVAS